MPGVDAAGLRRARAHDRAARHRRRPHAARTSAAASSRGIDLVGGDADADAQPNPQKPDAVERHGTELAGLLVGSGGPGGLQGVAPGATVLPIRVAGWQPTPSGASVVYARTDQLIAGLERAVDPNGDGDAHDAARIALIGVAEPFASFADSPEAQAVDGRARARHARRRAGRERRRGGPALRLDRRARAARRPR